MAIAFGTQAATNAGTTSVSPLCPSTLNAGDLMILAISNKYPSNGPATPTGWTAPANNQWSGGAGSAGVDSGTAYITVFYRVSDGTEAGTTVSVTITGGNAAIARIARYTKSAIKDWEVACTGGPQNTAGTAWSVTGAADPGITTGDFMFVASAINTDGRTFTSEALAATGCTFGTVTERQDTGTANGDDCGLNTCDASVTGGPSSAAPVFTMTGSATSTNEPAGASVFVRMREVDPVTAGGDRDPLGMRGMFGF